MFVINVEKENSLSLSLVIEVINESNKTCKVMIEHKHIDVYILSKKRRRNIEEFYEYIHLESLMRVLMSNVL